MDEYILQNIGGRSPERSGGKYANFDIGQLVIRNKELLLKIQEIRKSSAIKAGV
jgi:hypothetical protein